MQPHDDEPTRDMRSERSPDQAVASACRYCASDAGGRRTSVREMYFGSQERFVYIECAVCRSWCIATIPADMRRYYPREYGAHRSPTVRAIGVNRP